MSHLSICAILFIGVVLCKEPLNIHIISHSHDDPGWVKTFEEYYTSSVSKILTAVTNSLNQNPNRTFVYSEMSFFKRWWDEQNEEVKNNVKELLKKRQFEFVNGGWAQADEATTYYDSIIDQMTYGLRFIQKNFGDDARPTTAWQIDPFGHSAEIASILAHMSYNGLFMARIGQKDKSIRRADKDLEFIWRGGEDKSSEIFTSIFYDHYNPPGDICFTTDCPFQGFTNSIDAGFMEDFVAKIRKQGKSFLSNNMLVMIGDDFTHEKASEWFRGVDRIIELSKKFEDIKIFYSSPSRYLKALHDAELKWKRKTGDFFPYTDCLTCKWTGFYTSRPTFKRYVYESNNILQACKQLESLKGNFNVGNLSSTFLKEEVALTQHHDGVTGTQKQYVANNYLMRLYGARDECRNLMNKVIAKKSDSVAKDLTFEYCDLLNISSCSTTETKSSLLINLYNPLAIPVSIYVRIPIGKNPNRVVLQNGRPLTSSILPINRKNSEDTKVVVFYAENIPPVGYSTYLLKKTQKKIPTKPLKNLNEKLELENDFYKISFNENGRMTTLENKHDGITIDFQQNFYYYESNVGMMTESQSSGAYVFSPKGNATLIELKSTKFIEQKFAVEIHQEFSENIFQVIRLYKQNRFIEFEHTVGPIGQSLLNGKEVITRFKTSIKNKNIFYTDANGRQMKKRIIDDPNKPDNSVGNFAARNYYPVTGHIMIKNDEYLLSVLNDRPQGGSSLSDGQIEIMIHRRTTQDDGYGVDEPLTEDGPSGKGLVTTGIHRLVFGKPSTTPRLYRPLSIFNHRQPIISFAYGKSDEIQDDLLSNYSALKKPLPQNIHLLTLEKINQSHVIFRLEHMFEKGEDEELSKPAKVSIDDIFKEFDVLSLTELNLSANQLLKDKSQWDWKRLTGDRTRRSINGEEDQFIVKLKPFEIKTFILEVKWRE